MHAIDMMQTQTQSQPLTREERLAACDLVRQRFRGRAELRRAAERSENALDKLEAALEIISTEECDDRIRHRKLVHAFRVAKELEAWRVQPATKRSDDVLRETLIARAHRFLAVRGDPGVPGARLSRDAERAINLWVNEERERAIANKRSIAIAAALEAAYKTAAFRQASHAHDALLSVCVPMLGDEVGAWSSSDKISSASAGMSSAYCRKQYTVMQSTHRIVADAAILRVAHLAERGVLYLSETMRVVQGRGTALNVETLEPSARGLVRR